MTSHQRQLALDKMQALRQTDLFCSLSDDLLKEIAACTVTRHLDRGQVLFSEHEEASGLYVLADGELRSIRQNAPGREQVLSTERAGAVLSLVPLFNGGRHYSTAIAEMAAQVLYITRNDMRELCREHTELFWNVARVLAHKVHHLTEVVETLALSSVNQRVAQYLIDIACERGLVQGNSCLVELKLARSQMASRLGTAREVVSRALTHLHECGLIQLQGRRLVTIPDMGAFRDFAGFERAREEPNAPPEIAFDIA